MSVCVGATQKQQRCLLTSPIAALPAPDASSSWGAWLPVHFGSASDERRVEKLTRKLWEIDEVLGKPKEVTQGDLAAALEGRVGVVGRGKG